MKKILMKIYGIALLGIMTMSCSLEPVNFSQLAPDNSLNTESDLAAAVTGVYHEFRQGGWGAYNCSWGSLLTLQVGCTDEADCNWVWDQQLNYMWLPYDDTDHWESQFYTTFVPAITRITALLERMKRLLISAPVKRQCLPMICMTFTAQFRLLSTVTLLPIPKRRWHGSRLDRLSTGM